MNAKCPHCFGERSDCGECGGAGTVPVRFATGTLWTLHCNACGEENGGYIQQEGKPAPKTSDSDCLDYCVWCKSRDVQYVIIGDV